MKLSSIIASILNWIRRYLLLENPEPKTPAPYYIPVRSFPARKGTLYLVQGRDTDKAIRTWELVPNSRGYPRVYVCLDSLGFEQQYKKRLDRKTHKIEVVSISQVKNIHGTFNAHSLFTSEYDFLGDTLSSDLNLTAIVCTDKAALLLKYLDAADVNWDEAIDSCRCQMLGLEPRRKNPLKYIKRVLIMVLSVGLGLMIGFKEVN